MAKNKSWNNSKEGKEKKQKNFHKKGSYNSYGISGLSTLSEVAGDPIRKEHHSSVVLPPEKKIKEPVPICSMCSKPIENIAESFINDDGSFSHFECVLQDIKEREMLSDNETVSYIGSGKFGVFSRDEKGKYTLIKSIEVESKEDGKKFKDYVESLKV